MNNRNHEYVPAQLGHSSQVCKWCAGTPAENSVIAPTHCDMRPVDDGSASNPEPTMAEMTDSQALEPKLRPLLVELADTWEAMTMASDSTASRRETLRECADTLRMAMSAATPTIDTTLQPTRSPTHRCKVCGAFWMEWSSNWSLCSKACGPCCDNVAMGDQIEPG